MGLSSSVTEAGMDVLLVEDEALIRELLAEYLADVGLDVTEAPSAEAALGAVTAAGEAGQPPSVVVTDVNLGWGMDGLALVAEVQRRWPEVGVIVMTGNPANLNGRCFGPHEVCLLKPFAPSQLAVAVHDLIGRSCR
jgi:CheY-like chemotaxis protein